MTDANEETKPQRKGISRRAFLRGSGAAVAAVGVTSVAVGAGACTSDGTPAASSQGVATYTGSAENFYEQNAPPPPTPPAAEVLNFFTPDEAKTVDAFVGRVLPGTPEDPGAREANVVTYIDYRLSVNAGLDQPTYRHAPYAKGYEGDSPPPEAATDKTVVYVAKDELPRYGYQSILTPAEIYRAGLVELDGYCNSKYGKSFSDLPESQQDEVVGNLATAEGNASKGAQDEAGSAKQKEDDQKAKQQLQETGLDKFFKSPSAGEFFKEIHTDVINGMFSDPAYGGNKDMAGWKLISYPGAQRSYTPEDMLAEQTRPPQSLAMLHEFHTGQNSGPNVILPVSGPGRHESEQVH